MASDFVLFLRRCFWSSNLEKMELPGTAGHAIRSRLCMFWRGRIFSRNTRKCPKIVQKGSHFGLHFGPEIDQKCSKLVPGASGVQNRREGSDLGCKMEGKGPPWGAKWREKRAIWEHGGGTGACALDTPRQAKPAARRVKLWDLTESC